MNNPTVRVKVSIDKTTGEIDYRIVGHEGGASCSSGPNSFDEKLLNFLAHVKVKGFGENLTDEFNGLTTEGRLAEKSDFVPVAENKEEENEWGGFEKKEKQKVSLGFGV